MRNRNKLLAALLMLFILVILLSLVFDSSFFGTNKSSDGNPFSPFASPSPSASPEPSPSTSSPAPTPTPNTSSSSSTSSDTSPSPSPNAPSSTSSSLNSTIATCDSTGEETTLFTSGETIYLEGNGFNESTTYNVYLVVHQDWTNTTNIPAGVAGTLKNITTDSISFGPTAIWPSAQTGTYDVIVDVNNNGKYDPAVDPVEQNVIVTPLDAFPEYPVGTITAVAIGLAALILYEKRKALNRPSTRRRKAQQPPQPSEHPPPARTVEQKRRGLFEQKN